MPFFKKKEEPTKMQETPPVSLVAMPTDFYGGKDPVVRYEKKETVIAAPVAPTAPKPTPPANRPQPVVPMMTPSRRWPWVLGLVVLLLAITGGATWYYLNQAGYFQRPIVSVPQGNEPTVQEPVPETAPSETLEPAVTASSTETIVAPSLGAQPIEFPAKLVADTRDSDTDSLTDAEEETLGTDNAVYDTDGDGYYDGQEVFNLYNPKGIAPMKIIDSGVVKEYTHPTFGYKVYYPAQWEVAPVDSDAFQVLLSGPDGDYIEVRTISKVADIPFATWFSQYAVGQSFGDVSVTTNRFQIEMYHREDDLVGYVDTPGAVFVLVYHAKDAQNISYRHIMQMVMQSFRPEQILRDIPSQTPVQAMQPASPTSESL